MLRFHSWAEACRWAKVSQPQGQVCIRIFSNSICWCRMRGCDLACINVAPDPAL